MWVWPAIGFAWGFAAPIAFGPLGLFAVVGAFILGDKEHRAETVIGTALGTLAGLTVLAMLPGVASTLLGDLRLGA
jgi:MFS superfamily sulfate permease-like transporter